MKKKKKKAGMARISLGDEENLWHKKYQKQEI